MYKVELSSCQETSLPDRRNIAPCGHPGGPSRDADGHEALYYGDLSGNESRNNLPCHPERSEGSPLLRQRFFASLRMTEAEVIL